MPGTPAAWAGPMPARPGNFFQSASTSLRSFSSAAVCALAGLFSRLGIVKVAALGFATFGFCWAGLEAFGLAGAVFAALCFSAIGLSLLGSCALAVTVMPVMAVARHMPPIRLRVMGNGKGRLPNMTHVILSFRRSALGKGSRGRGRNACPCRRWRFLGRSNRWNEISDIRHFAANGRL